MCVSTSFIFCPYLITTSLQLPLIYITSEETITFSRQAISSAMVTTISLQSCGTTVYIFLEPGYYRGDFGVRLENVLEVIDKPWLKHGTGQRFYGFKDVTLVPFEPKLIDFGLLTSSHVITHVFSHDTRLHAYIVFRGNG